MPPGTPEKRRRTVRGRVGSRKQPEPEPGLSQHRRGRRRGHEARVGSQPGGEACGGAQTAVKVRGAGAQGRQAATDHRRPARVRASGSGGGSVPGPRLRSPPRSPPGLGVPAAWAASARTRRSPPLRADPPPQPGLTCPGRLSRRRRRRPAGSSGSCQNFSH